MQISHRGDKSDWPALALPMTGESLHGGNASYGAHRGKLREKMDLGNRIFPTSPDPNLNLNPNPNPLCGDCFLARTTIETVCAGAAAVHWLGSVNIANSGEFIAIIATK
jgi:hypothetical protein